MTEDEIRAAAQRIADEHLEFAEFSIVYEDEDLLERGATEDEWRRIHDLIIRSRAVL